MPRKPRKVAGLSLIELVDALHQHGFKSLADLNKIPPNPMEWNRNVWHLAMTIIAKSVGIKEKEVLKHYTKAADILKVFNEALTKTGLLVELEQVRKLSQKQHLKDINRQKSDQDFLFIAEE